MIPEAPPRLSVNLLAVFGIVLVCTIAYSSGFDVIDQYFFLVTLLLWVAFLLNATPIAKIDDPFWTPVGKLMAVLMASLIASSLLSAIPAMSFEFAVSFGSMPAIYFLARLTQRRTGGLDDLLTLLHWAGGVLAAIAIMEFSLTRTRTMSLLTDYNALAAFFNLCLFSQAGRMLARGKARPSTGQILLLALFAVALATTQSLGGLLTFSGGCTALLLMQLRLDRRNWITLALLPALVGLGYVFIMHFRQDEGGPLDRLAALHSLPSATNRVLMWKSVWHMFRDHPPLGIGLGMFKFFYSSYRDPGDVTSGGNYAHNDYLQALAEGGPLLLGCLLALLLTTLWRVMQRIRNPSHGASPDTSLTAGLLAGLLAVQVHAFINFIFYLIPLATGIGFLIARSEIQSTAVAITLSEQNGAADDVLSKPPRRRLGIALLLIAFAVMSATFGARGVFSTLVYGHCELYGCKLKYNQPFMEKLANYLEATQEGWLPVHLYLSDHYPEQAAAAKSEGEKQDWNRKALREDVETTRRIPRAGFAWFSAGLLLEASPEMAAQLPTGVPTDAPSYFRKAVEIDPQDMDARTHLADLMAKDGQVQQAFDLLFVDGMRWWESPMIDVRQHEVLLEHTIPLAIRLGRCNDAREMSQGLLQIKPQAEDLAQQVATQVLADAPQVAGCGLEPATP